MIEVIDKSIKTATEYFHNFFSQEYFRFGFLQSVDPRVKFICLVILLIAGIITFEIPKILAIAFSAVVLARLSNIDFRTLISRVWLFTTFSFLIVLPLAIFEGKIVYTFAFTLRVFTAITLLQLLVLTTPFNEILLTLRFFRIPETFVFTLGLTYRYIHLMFSELLRILIARESRRLKKMNFREIWKNGGKVLGSFFIRVFEKGEKVHLAMTLRGDKIKCYSHPLKIDKSEILFIIYVLVVLTWWAML
jgi:cobalt/nickel transport system permease protein